MPASNFGWSHNPEEHVFQVFTKKRKYECNQCPTEYETEACAKRLCAATTNDSTTVSIDEMCEINHNTIPPSAGFQQDMQQANVEQQLQQHQLNQNTSSTIASHQTDQPKSSMQQELPLQTEVGENDMVMDLCDETYSATLKPQNERMDSEPSTHNHGGSARSPTSGAVSCFCKPSWDRMLEMRTYVSDYY